MKPLKVKQCGCIYIYIYVYITYIRTVWEAAHPSTHSPMSVRSSTVSCRWSATRCSSRWTARGMSTNSWSPARNPDRARGKKHIPPTQFALVRSFLVVLAKDPGLPGGFTHLPGPSISAIGMRNGMNPSFGSLIPCSGHDFLGLYKSELGWFPRNTPLSI